MEQVNLLVGGNNSGKTSVLEALAVFCRPLDPWTWINVARSREIKASRIPLIESLTWMFPQKKTDKSTNGFYQGEIELVGDGTFAMREVRATLSEMLVERSLDNEGSTTGPVNGTEIMVDAKAQPQPTPLFAADMETDRLTETMTFQLIEGERFVQRQKINFPTLPVHMIGSLDHRAEQLQLQQMTETSFQNLQDLTVELLRSFDAGIQDIEILTPSGMRPTLYIRHQDFGLAPLSIFGDGMRRILLMATSISLCKGGVLLIDELEISLHTQALQNSFAWLVKTCLEHNIQLVATTHSLETLDTLLEVSKEQQQGSLVVHRLEQQKNQTSVTKLDEPLLTRLREEMGLEVRW
jgi:energy-coupling factor transporter ATP-binding protein EcfA2